MNDPSAMTSIDPFLLEPVIVERPWGGRRLEQYGKDLPRDLPIGESWELADLPAHVAPSVDDPSSRIATGQLAGRTLSEVISTQRSLLMGSSLPTADERFPLLVKLLDTREFLSVQVHPGPDYVASNPEARLKTESWYVVDAEPGSTMYLGLVDGTTAEDVNGSFGTGGILPLLREVPARTGEFHHVPAGLVHSLGPGVIVAEVQTPSDTTFRMYDWSAEHGRMGRSLHKLEAAASVVLRPPEAFSLEALSGEGSRGLVENEHYWMREHTHSRGAVDLARTDTPIVIMVVRGAAAIGNLEVGTGSTVVVPASSADRVARIDIPTTLLEIGLPPHPRPHV